MAALHTIKALSLMGAKCDMKCWRHDDRCKNRSEEIFIYPDWCCDFVTRNNIANDMSSQSGTALLIKHFSHPSVFHNDINVCH